MVQFGEGGRGGPKTGVEGRRTAFPPEPLPINTPPKGAAATLEVATVLGSVGVAVVVGGAACCEGEWK